MSDDIHALVGLYVVDALEDDERERFEAHLPDCTACTDEVAEFRATTSRLSGLMAENPPPALRSAIMERIGATRQASPVVRLDQARPRRASRRWIAPALAAAAAVVALLLGIGWGMTHRALDREESITAVLTAPDAETIPLDGSAPGDMHLVYSPSQDHSVVVADGLADVPSDRTYALWFISEDGTPSPAGLFRPDKGHARTIITGTPKGYKALGVTEEPSGGSPQPTGPILMVGNVV
jgi:anti-sigma-K factor RskA